MKLIHVNIISADTCGGLLDGFDLWFRNTYDDDHIFKPFCLIGPNGAGKSQFIQIIAEIFQSVFHAVIPNEERIEGNPNLQFEIEYLIHPNDTSSQCHIRISRRPDGRKKPQILIEKKVNGTWIICPLLDLETQKLLPNKIVGYTSGGNETLSLPFLLSRSGYAYEVSTSALAESETKKVSDTRLMLIDYGTHLEILVSNLLLGQSELVEALLQEAQLNNLHSFRCIIQLAHSAAPKKPGHKKSNTDRKGIQLTEELETYIDNLKRCSTCYKYDDKTETYIFDFFVDEQTNNAFGYFWKNSLDLYSAFHKLSMLNDLAIPKKTRERFSKEIKSRRFASRLPEPQDEDKVFRFERVNFIAERDAGIVDYVSLSDGEHQITQLLGTFSMVSFSNVLFLFDEPESHFNPQWRVKFISKLINLPTPNGNRQGDDIPTRQECLFTTHAPFVPSDMPKDFVLIFSKNHEEGKIEVRRPGIETFGTTFDAILQECFDVTPPISEIPRQNIQQLMNSNNIDEIKAGIEKLGHSVEKMFLLDRLRQLIQNKEQR